MRILTRTTAVFVLALTALLALPAVAFASEHAEDVPGESNLDFLMVGLILLWAGFFAYMGTRFLSRMVCMMLENGSRVLATTQPIG